MQLFVTIGKEWKLLKTVIKSFVFDVYGLLDPTPFIALYCCVCLRKIVGE